MTFSHQEFANPSAAWRGKPFWSWNGRLDKAELLRQIRVLKDMGMGGYFMHSRTGLETEYLGREWFELINACVEEGNRLGMESWLYDEDRWPSGTAGGKVTANPDYRMKFIHMQKFDGAGFDLSTWRQGEAQPLGAWSCRIENKIDIHDIAPVTPSTRPPELAGRTVLAFRVIPMEPGSFYNGNTYVDTLKRAATEHYIRLTHEAYKKYCGQHFGKGIRGIFTDEPHRGPFMSGFGVTPIDGVELTDLVPWTESIFDAFAKMHGSRVEEQLPSLFLRPGGREITQVKARYADTLLELFLENFAKPCLDWCTKNNLILTGHVLHENSLSSQVSTHGSVQRHYPLMHWPGIDFLCEHGREYWVAKQVDSTARQFNRKWILSELYGCTGWQMNFEAHKAIGAWQTLFGVNVRCHHLSWYTMRGEAKRDYPASIFHQSPWYREYAFVEDWFSRLGYFRSQGKPCCDLLVLNPVESVWGRMYPGAIRGMQDIDPGIKKLEADYARLFHILAGNQIDFDYGDEALLARHGSVVTHHGKPALRLGEMNYSTVLVAGSDTIRTSTLQTLTEFVNAGGRVVVAGEPPQYIDSLPSQAMKTLPASRCAFEEKAIVQSLSGHAPQTVRITDRATGDTARQVFAQLRHDRQGHYLTVLNVDREHAYDLTITVTGVEAGAVEEWDLDTGNAGRLAIRSGKDLGFDTTLHTSQARCFRLVKMSDLPMAAVPVSKAGSAAKLQGPVAYRLADPNICVLDTPSWSLDGGESHPANDILRIDRAVRTHYGKPLRAGDMVQPWFRGKETFPVLGRLTLRYPITLDAKVLPKLSVAQLVMESPDRFKVSVNGKAVNTSADAGWWLDIALRRLALPAGAFHEGKNEITVTCDFSEDLNLEALYLLGDFGVDLPDTTPHLRPLPAMLALESVVDQGLPYYSGSIMYQFEVPRERVGRTALIEVPDYEGAYLRVASGGLSQLIPWRPNCATMKLGESVEVEVCITRKNTFGPLHLTDPRPAGTGPHSFVPGDRNFSLKPVFIESGLLAPPLLRALEA